MAIVTRRFEVVREQSVLDDDEVDKGNSKHRVAPIGRYNGGDQTARELVYIPFEEQYPATAYQVKGARLWVYGAAENTLVSTTVAGFPDGTAPIVRVRPLVDGGPSGGSIFASLGGAIDAWHATASHNWFQQPDIDTDAPAVNGSMATGVGPRSINVASLVEWALPATILDRNGDPCKGNTNFGWRLFSPDETGPANNKIIYSKNIPHVPFRPYLEIDFEINRPPIAPEILTPEPTSSRTDDPTIVATISGRQVVVTFNFNDPEDALAGAAQLQILADGATDTAPGTPVAQTAWLTTATGLEKLAQASRYRITVAGLPLPHQDPAHGAWRLRLRTRDPKGAVGPWTSVDEGGIRTAHIIGAPVLASMQTKPDHPLIAGTINSPDPGDYITGWQGEFYKVTGQGSVNLWPNLSSPIGIGGSPTRSSVPYEGTPLNDGDVVSWRQRHVNRDEVVGLWSAFQDTVIRLPLGPTFDPPDTGTKLTSRTAEVDILFDFTSDAYQWFLYRDGDQIHDSGLVTIVAADSATVTLPSGKVGWGDLLEIEAQARPEGDSDLGPLSGRSGLQVDTLPSTETHLGDGEVEDVPVVGTTDIVIRTPYIDPDVQRYGEEPEAKEIEIRAAATPAGSGAYLQRRTRVAAITDTESLEPDLVIGVETSIDVRARYRDDADPKVVLLLADAVAAGDTNIKYDAPTIGTLEVGDEVTLGDATDDRGTRTVTAVGTAGAAGTGFDVSESYGIAHPDGNTAYVHPWGPWSLWATIKGSVDPVVTAVSPLGGAHITDPRPTLVHTYESIKAQAYRTVLLYERDPEQGDTLVYEEDIEGEGTDDEVPTLLLESGRTYAWQKIAYDADGLSDETELREFSTAFEAPESVEDLAATADPISSGVLLTWTAAEASAEMLVLAGEDQVIVTGPDDVVVEADSVAVDHYRVYWLDLTGNAIRIDGGPEVYGDDRPPLEVATLTWYGARLGTNLFRVTAHNGALESDIATVEVDLLPARDGASMFATDGLSRYTFPVDFTSAPRSRSPIIDVLRVPGGRTVHQVWGGGGRRVTARFVYIPTEDGDLRTPLDELLGTDNHAVAGTPTWVKLPEPYLWDVMRVMVVDLRDEPTPRGMVAVSVDLDETS